MIFLRGLKKYFWRLVEPIWPYVRDFLLKAGLIWHEPGRQRYHIGWLSPNKTPEEFKAYLETKGFRNNRLSWQDESEFLGVRKIDGDWQYHLRLFKDGEIRGHYEITTEADWYKHFWEIGMESRRKEFLEFLGSWVDTKRSAPQFDVHFAGAAPADAEEGTELVHEEVLGDRVLAEGDESGNIKSQR